MEYETLGLIIVALTTCLVWAILTEKRHRSVDKPAQLPPGPLWLPVVGNIFQIGWPPHVAFAKLARKHGPIMTLRLGSMLTVVVSSSQAAREMFKSNDVVLAGRKIYESMKGNHGHDGSLITSQYGSHWRMLRRLSTSKFFVTSRLDAGRAMRERCVHQMVRSIEDDGAWGTTTVDLGKYIFSMSFNLIGNLMFSRDVMDPKSERGAKFFYHANKVMELAAKPNMADFFPMFKSWDPQGIRRDTQFHVDKAFEIAGTFIKERLEETSNDTTRGGSGEEMRDFLDVLLAFRGDGVEEPSSFSPRIINVIVFEMFTAGTDTTTSTIEWAMAELLQNRTALQRVQTELRASVKPGTRLQEKDTDNLPYLKAVIKETLRLHPPLPFLVPHMAMSCCKMLGHHIPKDTQVLVNAWAIGRDPATWEDPLSFRPERFLDPSSPDFKGQHFDFIPFGSGRRMCPAVPLASHVLPLAVGSLLHAFDWVVVGDVDMRERMGMTLRKAVPLKAIPVAYKSCL